MNISNTDKWMVIGPGRTGSMVIVKMIEEVYRMHGIPMQIICRGANAVNELNNYSNIVDLPEGHILHTHRIEDLGMANRTVNCVLSTRDLVDAAMSHSIRPYIGKFHLYGDDGFEVTPFRLNLDVFNSDYNRSKEFYTNFRGPKHTIVLDYDVYADRNVEIVNHLGLACNNEILYNKLPKRHSEEPSQWLLNWEEVKPYINSLERRPEKYLRT